MIFNNHILIKKNKLLKKRLWSKEVKEHELLLKQVTSQNKLIIHQKSDNCIFIFFSQQVSNCLK